MTSTMTSIHLIQPVIYERVVSETVQFAAEIVKPSQGEKNVSNTSITPPISPHHYYPLSLSLSSICTCDQNYNISLLYIILYFHKKIIRNQCINYILGDLLMLINKLYFTKLNIINLKINSNIIITYIDTIYIYIYI